MSIYLLVGVLLLSFNVNLWVEGRLPEELRPSRATASFGLPAAGRPRAFALFSAWGWERTALRLMSSVAADGSGSGLAPRCGPGLRVTTDLKSESE